MTQSDEITIVEVPGPQRSSQAPIREVRQTWVEQGAWCAFAEESVVTCSNGCEARSKVLLRTHDYDQARAVAFGHRAKHPHHRVIFEVTQRLTLTTPIEQ